jgi:Cu+-exporting ATPase
MAEIIVEEVPVQGMDCAECTHHVKTAIAKLPGVASTEVFLSSEKAVVQFDPDQISLDGIRQAIQEAGYTVPNQTQSQSTPSFSEFTGPILTLLGVVFGVVLFTVVVGEWFGLFEAITQRVPWSIGLVIVLLTGYPVFVKVIKASLKGQIISHTLMSLGVVAALAVGEWATAIVVVFFMRVGDYTERFTTERARRAVKDLSAMAPLQARLLRDQVESEVPIGEVKPGDVVIVRPGEKIPVDGEVISGQATLNQAAITGESMPVEAGPGNRVFAATLTQLGSLRVRVTQVGADSTFGRVIKLVEEAEMHRADVQRISDKVSAYYLPVVTLLALLTYLLRRDPLATAAVLIVTCSCSFALATPIAMLASIGAGAKRGLMIKGGKYLELLAKADILLIDKTGTLTQGRPQITDIEVWNSETPIPEMEIQSTNLPGNGDSRLKILSLAAAAERYSEHPLAEAVRLAASQEGLLLEEVQDFEAIPGVGVRAKVDGKTVMVGNHRMVSGKQPLAQSKYLETQGKSVLYVEVEGKIEGILAASDALRVDVPQAIEDIKAMGIKKIELLTGDNQSSAAELANQIGVQYRAELLPEDKIAIVKHYQQQGHTVIMVGDGVNDAPALAQADIGIAMGAMGTDIAIESAHITIMRDEWGLIPQVLQIAHRTMRVVKMNLAFTIVYNLVGLSLASLGFLPPIFAAVAQSLPDLGILANSSRLLVQSRGPGNNQN